MDEITTGPTLIIEPKINHKNYVRELVSARELIFFFAWRDILVRYKEAFFGILWAIIRPLLTMAIFTFLFSRLASFPSMGVPYSLFALAGMVPWIFFSSCLTETTLCLLNNPALITRIYFPRMVLPCSSILVQGVDFLVAFAMLIIYGIYMGGFNGWTLIFIPFPLILLFFTSLGFGLILSSLTVRFKDVRYIVPFFVQFWLYASPIGYGAFIVPSKWQWLYSINPLVGIIELFRFSLFGIASEELPMQVAIAAFETLFIFWGGFVLFRSLEGSFGDDI